MAQLVWRPVEAQQGSLRDIVGAGQTITNSFDRLGELLSKREESLRTDATNSAVAEAFMAGTPEEVAALRARGLTGLNKRVNAAEFAKALGQAENDILARSKDREELANLQAFAQMGDEQAEYVRLLGEGKRDEANAFAARMAQENPDMWGRVAYGTTTEGEGIFDRFTGRKLEAGRDAVDARYKAESAANDRARVALAARADARDAARFQLQQQEAARARQEDKDRAAARRQAEAMAPFIPTSFSDDKELLKGIRKSKTWQNLPEHARGDFEQTLMSRYTDLTSTTEDELARGSNVIARGVPSFLVPGAAKAPVASVNALQAEANGALSRSKVVQAGLTQRTMGRNPYVQVFQTNAGLKAQPTIAEVVNYAKENTDIIGDAAEIERVKLRHGLSNGEVMALLETVDFNSSLTNPMSWGGKTEAFNRHAAAYAKARDYGDITGTLEAISNKVAPFKALEAQLESRLARARREAGRGQASRATQAEIMSLVEQLRALKMEEDEEVPVEAPVRRMGRPMLPGM